MIRIIIIIIINLIFINGAQAGFWQRLKQCFTNPCNCGGADRIEIWNGESINKGPENLLCPPYAKHLGRADHTCIAGLEYPKTIFELVKDTFVGAVDGVEGIMDGNTTAGISAIGGAVSMAASAVSIAMATTPVGAIQATLGLLFKMGQNRVCAEYTTESTFFTPKVKLRQQTCNAVACWGQNSTIKWDGECVNWPGPMAAPLTRVCARVALPSTTKASADKNKPAEVVPPDPGYTVGMHLNKEGYPEYDEPFESINSNPVVVQLPKLCVYVDPSSVDMALNIGIGVLTGGSAATSAAIAIASGGEMFDWDVNSQGIHKTPDTHPIAKLLRTMVDAGSPLESAINFLLNKITGEDNIINKALSSVLKAVFTIFGKFGSIIIDEFGQFNRMVTKSLGCVDIPMGPYPPPFCDRIQKSAPNFKIQPICELGENGIPILTSEANKCVVSTKGTHNVIRNLVRIGFNKVVPVCNPGVVNIGCITFSGGYVPASILHIATARKDFVHSCSSGINIAGVCVNTTITEPPQGFRIVYGLKIGSTVTPSDFYIEDDQTSNPARSIPDCSATSSGICQLIYGINIGQFEDVELTFPEIEVHNNVSNFTKTVTLQDPEGNSRSANVSIVRVPTYDTVSERQITPNQICATESSQLVGCVERNLAIKPKLYECSAPPIPGLICTSTYYNPKFIAGIIADNGQGGQNASYVIAEPANVSSTTGGDVIIAGYSFSPFVTDNNLITKPFTGTNAFNGSTIHGEYKNNEVPYDSNGDEKEDVVYLKGLEYINDAYMQGGTYACMQPLEAKKCPQDKTMCVLAKLLNANIVNCASYMNVTMRQYGNLYPCGATHTGCSRVETVNKLGGGTIEIVKCTGDKYCYNGTGGVELCVQSRGAQDRVFPNSSLGNTLSSNQYFDVQYGGSSGIIDLDPRINYMRDKTAIEMGLCTAIPQPTCAARSSETEADGYASWPETNIGELAQGTCLPDYEPKDPNTPLERYCLSKIDTKTVKFDDLPFDKSGKLPANFGCKKIPPP